MNRDLPVYGYKGLDICSLQEKGELVWESAK